MSCKIEIEETIEKSINDVLPYREVVMSEPTALKIKKDLNDLWGDIAKEYQYSSLGGYKVVISDISKAVDREYSKQIEAQANFERNLDFFNGDQQLQDQEEQRDAMFQKQSQTMTQVASPKTIASLKDFTKRIGVDISSLEEIVVNGIKQDANGAALLMQKLIQVVNGKESQALPEEAMHFAVAIIKQTNPAMYKKLMGEINSYKILKEVFTTYGTDRAYQLSDGKPNVIKLKEEAIAKVLADSIIQQSENSQETPESLAKVESWWSSIIEFFKGLFSKSGFDQTAMDILSGKEMGTAEDIKEAQDTIFLQKDKQTMVWDKLRDISSKITKIPEGYSIDGKKIRRRVSDLVKDWYASRFENKDLTKSDYAKAVDEMKAEKGTAGHADLEHILSLLIDDNGFVRENMLDDPTYISLINPNDRTMYNLLKVNLIERVNSFPKGTRFMSEITVYDAKRDLAGTIDFLAITPEGKVNVLDWKFMNLNTNKYTDIPWYKVNAWRNQMNQYKLILQNVYGIEAQNFEQTRMIPILTVYSEGNAKTNTKPQLLSIKIGDIEVKNIKEDFLLPVGLEGEKTNNKKIDALLVKLNAAYTLFSEKKALPSDRLNKNEQLNLLFMAIRQLQIKGNIKPLLYQAKVLNRQVERTLKAYTDKYVGKDALSFSDEEVNAFAEELSNIQDALSIYTNLDVELKSLFQGTLSDEDNKLKGDLRDTTDNARDLSKILNDIFDEFTSEIIVKGEKIDYFMQPEKIIKGITRWLSSTSTLQTKAIEFLYKKANKAFAFVQQDTVIENRKLAALKDGYEKMASSKGLTKKNYFDLIKKKTSNHLIDEFDPEFFSALKTKIEEKDTKWIRDNIDVVAYNKFLKEKLDEELLRIDGRAASKLGTLEEIENEIKREKYNARALYNTSTTSSPGWLLYEEVNKFPKENWISKEWAELNKPENKPAKDFYDYIRLKNKEYQALNYIGHGQDRIFLPFMRKGLTEKLITGGNVSLGEQFLRDISIDEGDIGYGKIDPLTGKPIDVIPKYFTSEIEGEVSTDLFRTISFYNEAAIKYKYLSRIEHMVTAVATTERNKRAIKTSQFGKTQYKEGEVQYTEDNSENSGLFNDMVKGVIYGQKFLVSESFDTLLGKIGTWGPTLNKKLGINIFPENLSERQLSVNKVISQLNNAFQLSTMGLNILSAGSNYFGGNMHSIINSGKYFTEGDYMAAQGMIVINKMNGTDKRKMIGVLEYFLPLTDNYNKELAKKLSINTMTAESLQDGLMWFMRQSDWNVQTANFYAYLNNTIVQDGQVLNVREYLRTTPKYTDRYSNTSAQRKALDIEFEKDVKSLIEEKGVLKVGGLVGNEFVIPGVEQKSQSVVELRRKVQQISKNALGNLSEDDLRKANMTIYGKSFMVFKNWIPRLVDVRTGNMKYNSASDAYEWGRMRMVFNVISEDIFKSLGRLRNSLIANEKGVEYMREMFEKKKAAYKLDTGKDLQMTSDEFMDLVRGNIKSSIVDLVFLLTLFALVTALKANAPDDDEDPMVKNQYRFITRAADKFKDELMYFYDPTSLSAILSQGFFPSVAMITNFTKGMKNFFIENWAISTGDDETVKDTKVIKYWMKSFPFSNQMLGYLPLFYPDAAKDLGIKVQSNYGMR